LIFESVGIDAWSRLCDQRLVGNVWVTLRRRLGAHTAQSKAKESYD
jgi:hypothetical protein